ncbi:MAG: YvrJ family protein [Peptostreptococcaceae bacterium]|nr:YvrJ family protein [Peptostreptococcaceae bacterium]
MEEMLQQVANFGFPMVLSIYLLVRLESKMENLSASIQRLSIVVENATERKMD